MEKVKTSNNITLAENNKSVKEDGKICETFNTYFTNSFNLRVAQKHQWFDNEESCRLIKYHFGN